MTLVETMAIARGEDLREGFVRRLRRLLRMRFTQAAALSPDGVRFLDEMIVRSFIDCVAAGDGERARRSVAAYREAWP